MLRSRTPPPLDYLQPSPVRGQLEPLDETTTKSGCRFIQCTDTPNELKVLLPPHTAHAYTLLLKAELVELEKRHDASWERILDIRRLKDRMIRKCQRLAKIYFASNPGATIPFLTLHAPPDFRVKEIEKWIRLQHSSDASKKMTPSDALGQRGSFCCDRCANLVPHNHTVSSRRPTVHVAHPRRSSVPEKSPSKGIALSRRPSMSTSDARVIHARPPVLRRSAAVTENTIQRATDSEVRSKEHTSFHTLNHIEENITSRVASSIEESSEVLTSDHRQSVSIDANRFATESRIQETKNLVHTIVENRHELGTDQSDHSCIDTHSETESLARLSIASPVPLPVPYHGSTSAAFMDICDSPIDVTRSENNRLRHEDSSAEDSGPSPPSEDEPALDTISRSGIPRRRSSLKRNNSELRMSMAYSTKTVSWAMDRDWAHQMTKYHAATAQVEDADAEWGIFCRKYQEELAGLKVLRRNVSQTLLKLRIETEKLQREDEVMRDQEEKLRQGYEQLEQKHGQYREKVKAVLQETEQVLTLCGTKRDAGS